MAFSINHRSSLGRMFGISRIGSPTPYMLRIWFGRLRWHTFYRGDDDPDCHDQPWSFTTFPLTSYVEEYVDLVIGQEPITRYRVVKAFRFHHRPATFTHRVLGRWDRRATMGYPERPPQIKTGKIHTIVWRGNPERDWGFLKKRDGEWCWVGFKEYIWGGGKDAPCGD